VIRIREIDRCRAGGKSEDSADPAIHPARRFYARTRKEHTMPRTQFIPTTLLALFSLGLLCPGCAAERPGSVPEDARRLAKHSGTSSFVFTAPGDGEVFIYDRTQNKLVYSGRVRRGESLEVDAKDDRITLNARVVSEEDLRDLDEYEIWFDEGPGTGQ
jgi:hypothetical protein